MAIEFACPHCSATLRVDDENAGKAAKCPSCQLIASIPRRSQSLNTALPQPGGYPYADTAESPATQLPYARPHAASPPTEVADKNYSSDNPYSAPNYEQPAKKKKNYISGNNLPTTISVGAAFGHAWDRWKDNLGILVGTTVVMALIDFAGGTLEEFSANESAALGIRLVFQFISTLLGIGMARICLGLCRDQPVEFGMLFRGGDKLLPVIGMTILYSLLILIGFVLLIIPGVLVALVLWPYYYYIIDYQCSAMDSFSRATEVGKINMTNSFLLTLIAIGLGLLGLVAVLIGLLFTLPLIYLTMAAAYLMMKVEIRSA